MRKVTAIIPCYNEIDHIGEAIESVSWADEIIVVDSFSTDGTYEYLLSVKNIQLHQRTYQNSANQKNWIIPQATHEWIFLLDADERVPAPLRDEVLKTLEDPGEFHAFWIPRENFFLGRSLKHTLRGDAVIRLFRRDTCRYRDLQVHAEIETDHPVGRLKNRLAHHSYKSARHFLKKMERYAEWSAADHDKRTGRVGAFHLLVKPAFRFFKHYVINGGFLDGRAGLIVSVVMAWGVFLRYLKMIELRKR
jgi:glycosyltransferase involved in cell wall biosynthesis